MLEKKNKKNKKGNTYQIIISIRTLRRISKERDPHRLGGNCLLLEDKMPGTVIARDGGC